MEIYQHNYYIAERSKKKRLIRKKNQSVEDRELLFKNKCYDQARIIYELKYKLQK